MFSRIDLVLGLYNGRPCGRSFSGEQTLRRYVRRGSTKFTVVYLVVESSQTVGCVGESYIDEPLVGTVILPQIGELPVHLSIGEV